jgi:hypothetical protein
VHGGGLKDSMLILHEATQISGLEWLDCVQKFKLSYLAHLCISRLCNAHILGDGILK